MPTLAMTNIIVPLHNPVLVETGIVFSGVGLSVGSVAGCEVAMGPGAVSIVVGDGVSVWAVTGGATSSSGAPKRKR